MGCDFSRSKQESDVTELPLSSIIKTDKGEYKVTRSEPTPTFTTTRSVDLAELSISLKAVRQLTSFPYEISNLKRGKLVKATHHTTRKQSWVELHTLKSDNVSTEMKKKLTAMRELDHPNVLKVLDIVHCGNQVLVAYENWEGGDAEKLQKAGPQANGMSENWAVAIMRQLLSALQHCHSHKLVLKSLSLRNILFLTTPTQDSVWVKLLVPLVPDCSDVFAAPEVRRATYTGPVNDVFSCGMIFQSLLLGNCWDVESKDTCMSTNLLKIMIKRWENMKQDIQKLTLSMIRRNHLKRISLTACLTHPGLTLVSSKPTLTPALRASLRNLTQCKPATALKKTLLQLMLNMVLPSERLWETQQSFRDLDIDGNGTVSEEELRTQIYRLLPEQQADSAFALLTSNVDFTDNRELSYSEFQLFAVSRQVLFAFPHISLTFHMLDRAHDQRILSRELQEFFSLGQFDNSNTRAWQALISGINKCSDDSFNYNQLTKFLIW